MFLNGSGTIGQKRKEVVEEESATVKKKKTEEEGDNTSNADSSSTTHYSLFPTLNSERARAEVTQTSDCERVVMAAEALVQLAGDQQYKQSLDWTAEMMVNESHERNFKRQTAFTQTSGFERRTAFTQTSGFERQTVFTQTSGFERQTAFTQTSGFERQTAFTQTSGFERQTAFTQTSGFERQTAFTQTSGFERQTAFTQTSGFEIQAAFSEISGFERQTAFIQTPDFEIQTAFTRTSDFEIQTAFTQTSDFEIQTAFSQTPGFARQTAFTRISDYEKGDDGDIVDVYDMDVNGVDSLEMDGVDRDVNDEGANYVDIDIELDGVNIADVNGVDSVEVHGVDSVEISGMEVGLVEVEVYGTVSVDSLEVSGVEVDGVVSVEGDVVDSVKHRSQLVSDLVARRRWDDVLPLITQPISRQAMYATLQKAVRREKWSWINEVLWNRMLMDGASWPVMASVLNQWICTMPQMYCQCLMPPELQNQPAADRLRSLKQWCVTAGHSNLAFFLAMVSYDLQTVEMLARAESKLHLHQTVHRTAISMAVDFKAYSAGAALLRLYPLDTDGIDMLDTIQVIFTDHVARGRLAKACEKEGLLDWALALKAERFRFVLKNYQQCQNKDVIDFLLVSACELYIRRRVTFELAAKCTTSKTLRAALTIAVTEGRVRLAKSVIDRVNSDISSPTDPTFILQTLLYRPTPKKVKIMHLLVQSGLSTFEREVTKADEYCVVRGLRVGNVRMVKLLLASGAWSHWALHQVRENNKMPAYMRNKQAEKKKWKKCRRLICAAAATPCSLVQLARLAVSHRVGVHPGRSARIMALPVPLVIKDFISFRDIK